METTTRRPASPIRGRTRRVVLAGAALAATATIGLGVDAVPVRAAPHNPCATARAAFRAHMNEARFWIGAADQLAAAGNQSAANQASAEVAYYLGLAEGALGDMSAAC